MPAKVVDILSLVFTEEIRDTVYVPAGEKEILLKLGVWDRTFEVGDIVRFMDAAGIEKAFIPAQNFGLSRIPYDTIAEIVAQHPQRLYGMAGIDPTNIERGVRSLERAINERHFIGAHSYPHWFGLSPADAKYYPFYAKCVELNVPIQIQAGIASQARFANVGHPATIDVVARDFPALKIIGIHTGYPWEREMVAASWKHEHVYIGADHRHPRDWSPDLVEYIKGAGREKVLFGTNHPALNMQDAVAGVDALGIDDDVKALLLRENALRVYRLGS